MLSFESGATSIFTNAREKKKKKHLSKYTLQKSIAVSVQGRTRKLSDNSNTNYSIQTINMELKMATQSILCIVQSSYISK